MYDEQKKIIVYGEYFLLSIIITLNAIMLNVIDSFYLLKFEFHLFLNTKFVAFYYFFFYK